MAGSLVKQIMMAITADPGDSHEVLDDLSAKADQLKEPVSLNIAADTGEADEQVTALDEALQEYRDAAAGAMDAQERLAGLQDDGSASASELAAAQQRATVAARELRDAQLQLGEAELDSSDEAAVAAARQEELGLQSEEAGVKSEAAAGASEKAWEGAKLAFLGVGAALVYGVVKAAGFQSVMETLHTQAGVTQGQLGMLSSGVLQLAGQVGSSPDSLAGALYHVESSFQSVGITGPKALSLLKVAAEGAATGHADLTDVTNALDATIVAGVPGIKNYSQAMGALNAIVGSGDMTMQDLASAMGSGVMAVAKSYGQSITQVGAALAVLGDNNIRGAKAATDLRMAWQAMLAPIDTAGPALAKLGLTDTQLGSEMEHHGMSAAIAMFIQHLKASKIPMSDWGMMMTDIFGKKAGVGIGILVDQFSRLQSKFPDIEKGMSGFGAAWKAQQKTAGQQVKDLEDGVEALATNLGTKLLPATTTVVHGLASFAEWMEKGSGWALTVAGVLGGVLGTIALEKLKSGVEGAVGGLQSLYHGGEQVVSGISSIITKLTAQAAAQDEVTAATEEQTVATEAETVAQEGADAAMDDNPIGAIVMALTLLAVGIYEVVKHWKDFKQWGGDALHFVEHAGEDVLHWFEGNWPYILGILTGPVGLAAAIIYKHFGTVKHYAEDAFHVIEDAADDAIHWVGDHWPLLLAIITGPIGLATLFVVDHWHQIVDGAEEVIHDVGSWFGRLPGMVLSWVSSFGHLLWNAGADLLRGLIGGIESEVGDVVGTVEHVGDDVLHGIEGALGIGSPSKYTRYHGQMVAEGLVLGMGDKIPLLEAESRRMGLAALSGLSTPQLAGGSGGAGAAGTLQVQWVGGPSGSLEHALWDWLRANVRFKGGGGPYSAQKALGSEWPR